jgi:hypothetical protein
MKNKRRIIIGGGLAILMSPVILAGFLYGFVSRYFVSGDKIFDVIEEELVKYLEKYDD